MKNSEEKQRQKAAREEERRQRSRARMERHVVSCPHCGKEALDHMTKCPHCGGSLTASGGYAPMSEDRRKKVRRILWLVLGIAAVVGLGLFYYFKR